MAEVEVELEVERGRERGSGSGGTVPSGSPIRRRPTELKLTPGWMTPPPPRFCPPETELSVPWNWMGDKRPVIAQNSFDFGGFNK